MSRACLRNKAKKAKTDMWNYIKQKLAPNLVFEKLPL